MKDEYRVCDNTLAQALCVCVLLQSQGQEAVMATDDDVTLNNPTDRSYLFSVSIGRSPAIYWLGAYSDGKFDVVNAIGPQPLDLGDLLYAPNVLQDAKVCWNCVNGRFDVEYAAHELDSSHQMFRVSSSCACELII